MTKDLKQQIDELYNNPIAGFAEAEMERVYRLGLTRCSSYEGHPRPPSKLGAVHADLAAVDRRARPGGEPVDGDPQ
jgi:hypothetical protein